MERVNIKRDSIMNHYIVLTTDGQICDVGEQIDFDGADTHVAEILDLESAWIATLGDWQDMFKDAGYKLTSNKQKGKVK